MTPERDLTKVKLVDGELHLRSAVLRPAVPLNEDETSPSYGTFP